MFIEGTINIIFNMADNIPDSVLFESLEGDLTEEQWLEFKKLREVAGDLVSNSSSDSEEYDELVGDSYSQYLECQIKDQAGPSYSIDENEPLAENSELTMRYLKGELSFSEFTTLAEQQEAETITLESELGDQEHITKRYDEHDGFEVEMEFERELKKQKKRGRRSRLPKDMVGLMGQANLCFARGQQEDAIKMCMEIIRQVPTAPEPFQTLGILYEESGDMEKSLQFSLIAAHLGPSDLEEWVRLAVLSLELGNVKQAITCYNKAIKFDPNNIELLQERSLLYEKLNDWKKVLEGYQAILKALPLEEGEEYLRLAREIAKIYHDNGEDNHAIEIMKQAFIIHSASLTSEDVNMFLELLISLKMYDKCVEVLCEHCGVLQVFDTSSLELSNLSLSDESSKPIRCTIPDALPIDLRIKLVISLIYLKCFESAKDAVLILFQESPEEMGDLFLDVAEAYMENGEYKEALSFLNSLVHSKKYNLAAVWLKHGECLNALGDIQNAVVSYKHVVELAPTHLGARVSLSILLQQLGKPEEALKTLSHGGSTTGSKEVSDEEVQLTLHRCTLLHSQGLWSDFIDASKGLLSRLFKDFCKPSHVSIILKNRSLKHRREALRQLQGIELEKYIPPVLPSGEFSATIDDLWDLYLKVCNTLVELKRFSELEILAIAALTCPKFISDPIKSKETEFICMIGCYLNKNYDFVYSLIKDICIKAFYWEETNIAGWNFFNQVISLSQNNRHKKFCMRLTIKRPNHYILSVLNGNNCMVSGSYKHSLGEYAAAYKQNSKDPLLCLCIGLTFIHMASQRFSTKRHSLVIQGSAFLNRYLELRGHCQETYYNIGRAMHQLGLLHATIFYYKKALDFPCAISEDKYIEIYDLKHEIAFNLYLIYQASGDKLLAKLIMQQYL